MNTLKMERLSPVERYKSLGLKRNPFPADGAFLDPPEVELFPDERLLKELNNFLNSLLSRRKEAKGRALIGDYGTGKTYYLKHIRYYLGKESPEVAIFYVEHPGYGFHDLVGSIIRTIGLGNIVRKQWSLIREQLLIRIKDKDLNWYYDIFPAERGKFPVFSEAGREHLLEDYRIFLDRAKKQKSDANVITGLFSEMLGQSLGIDANVARRLARILAESHYKSYFDWEDIAPTKRKEIGDYEFLSAILHLIHKVDKYRGILILIDEFEEIPVRFSAKGAADYEYSIRRLHDLASKLPFPLGMLIAMTPPAWDTTQELCRPLAGPAGRLMRPIWIQPLTKEWAEMLVIAYLNKIGREKARDDLIPLPQNLWELLPDIVRDNPRNLLNFCHEVIEDAATRQVNTISEELVKEYADLWRYEFREMEM
ncbi:MAG: hypothetical protein DDT31_01048 [Syntrophomonadaceae bacterium]|nr:hypothetical protein [Bacillota bacterium]MBT9138483.1 hypothetical protein [Bacillota bacterium]